MIRVAIEAGEEVAKLALADDETELDKREDMAHCRERGPPLALVYLMSPCIYRSYRLVMFLQNGYWLGVVLRQHIARIKQGEWSFVVLLEPYIGENSPAKYWSHYRRGFHNPYCLLRMLQPPQPSGAVERRQYLALHVTG